MLAGLSPARRRFLLGTAVAIAVVVGVLVAVAVRARDAADPVAQGRPGPVLLVSGYGGSAASLEPMRLRLRAAGREALVVPAVGDGTGDLRRQARALGRAAAAAMKRYDARSVDVVGYSAGGVVAREWVRDLGGASVARRVLSVASPQHGTSVAELAAGATGCQTACEQLEPDSDLLRELNARDETPPGPLFVSVWSTADRTVVPPSSARLSGAALNLTVQSVCPTRRTTHSGMPADPVVLALLRTALGPGRPAAPPSTMDCGIR